MDRRTKRILNSLNLTAKQRHALILRARGRSYEYIGKLRGVSASAIHQMLLRIKRKAVKMR